jgi:Glycosyl transferase 4-like domain
MRIVRLANFVAAHSGGLRTSLRELGQGYLAAGHEPVLIIPGELDSDQDTTQGRVLTLRGPRVPFMGGYRVLLRRRHVAALLSELRPDTLEVSDRTTLRWTGQWARAHGVPAVMVSHENLTALLRLVPLAPARAAADALNRRTARAYQQVICTTAWAAAEFERIGAGNVARARAASTNCCPRRASRSVPVPTPSRPASRPRGWRSSPGWPPRARRGCRAGPRTWCRRWPAWLYANGWAHMMKPRNGNWSRSRRALFRTGPRARAG